MICPNCGAQAVAEGVFCAKCGARLSAATADVPAGQSPAVASPAPALQSRAGVADVPEQVLWEGGYAPKAMIGSWLLAALGTVALVAVALVLATNRWVPLALIPVIWIAAAAMLAARRLGVHYKLTNQRFFHERGILRRTTNRIEVIDIDDLSYEQGLLDRLVGTGKIKIVSSDRTDPGLTISGIDDVQQVFTQMDKARRAERMRRGMTIEAV